MRRRVRRQQKLSAKDVQRAFAPVNKVARRPAAAKFTPPPVQSRNARAYALGRNLARDTVKMYTSAKRGDVRGFKTGAAKAAYHGARHADVTHNRAKYAKRNKLLKENRRRAMAYLEKERATGKKQQVVWEKQVDPKLKSLLRELVPVEQRANKLALNAYSAHQDELWNRASRFYPKGSKRPGARYILDDELAAFVKRPKRGRAKPRDVTYTTGAARALMNSPEDYPVTARRVKNADAYAESVPIHEWAHVFQSDRVRRGNPQGTRALKRRQARVEGNAEAFEQLIAKRLGLRGSTSKKYRPLARRARRNRGFVLKGQFR